MKRKESVVVNVHRDVHELLKRTADRNNVNIASLAAISVESFIGSIERWGLQSPKAERAAPKSKKGTFNKEVDKVVTLPGELHEKLNDIGVYLGVPVTSMVRDSILAQRFNWQRMQPINARNMSSVRMVLFELEQTPSAKSA
tara:strand:- start:7 stop:432 length:426 start_codon:yes stop_codon:yes gene_type:complete